MQSDTTTLFTATDLATVLALLGAMSGIFMYLVKKNRDEKQTDLSIIKTEREIESIEQEIESKHAEQLKRWLNDIQEINEKYTAALDKKDKVIEDIHKKYLEVIKEMTEQELKNERFVRATRKLVTQMKIAYWECDSAGKLIYANGDWLKLFGLQPEEAQGEGWLSGIPENQRESLLVEWYSRVVDHKEEPLEFTLINPRTNEEVKMRGLYSIIYDNSENIVKIIGVTLPIH